MRDEEETTKTSLRPTGELTFLLTDVEGSTRLWERDPGAMAVALARHDALVEAAVERHGGVVVRPRGEGDSRFAVFACAPDAVAAAAALQWTLQAEPWPPRIPLRVRVALHTGAADARAGDYYGPAVNRCARLRDLAAGGQVLLSGPTARLVRDALPPGADLRDLGIRRLRDLVDPEAVFLLVDRSLAAAVPSAPWPDAARSTGASVRCASGRAGGARFRGSGSPAAPAWPEPVGRRAGRRCHDAGGVARSGQPAPRTNDRAVGAPGPAATAVGASRGHEAGTWLVLADPVQVALIELGFLHGREEPAPGDDGPGRPAVFAGEAIARKCGQAFAAAPLYRGCGAIVP